MVKQHNIKLTIKNNCGYSLKYQNCWFDSGRVADGFSFENIGNASQRTLLMYEKDNASTGCSGYVNFRVCGKTIGIGFSNPFWGYNKLGIDKNGGEKAWDNMGSPYKKWEQKKIDIDSQGSLLFCFTCSGGTTNIATIEIYNTLSALPYLANKLSNQTFGRLTERTDIKIESSNTWSSITFMKQDKSSINFLLYMTFKLITSTDGKNREYASNVHLTCQHINGKRKNNIKSHVSFDRNWDEIESWYNQCCIKDNMQRDTDMMKIFKHLRDEIVE